jgi:uncharacterized transporter YbjL
MTDQTYQRVLSLVQACVAAGQVINVALAMQHGSFTLAVAISAFLAGAQQYLHTEGRDAQPPGQPLAK